jgi:hypothetical protein
MPSAACPTHVGQQAAGGNCAKPAARGSPSQHFGIARQRRPIDIRILEYLPAFGVAKQHHVSVNCTRKPKATHKSGKTRAKG